MSAKVEMINEISNALQYVNLVRVRFGDNKNWGVYPVFEINEETVDIIVDLKKDNVIAKKNEKAILKFQSQGYEYIIKTEVFEIMDFNLITISYKNASYKKFLNIRKHMRFETEIPVQIYTDKGVFKGVMNNLSLGGAFVSSKKGDIGNDRLKKVEVVFDSGVKFSSTVKIVRKTIDSSSEMNYGFQFIHISEKNNRILKKEIHRLEKKALNSFNLLKEYNKNNDMVFSKKIFILNYNEYETLEIRESLVKLGADNYEVFHNFQYYVDFFQEEKPDIVVIDTHEFDKPVTDVVERLKENFPDIALIILTPLDYADEIDQTDDNCEFLYKPLVYNEFEETILKYL